MCMVWHMRVELKNQGFSAAVSSLGAELVSLKNREGTELLWQGDEAHWRGQAPVLFPIVGALRGGKAQIEGNWFEMGQHGFARRREFAVTAQEQDAVSFRLTSDYETMQQYPYAFALTVTYRLTDTGITTSFAVENTGEQVMPFSIGGHPGFQIPCGESGAFEEYVIEFEQEEHQRCPAIDLSCALIDDSRTAFTLEGEKRIPLTHALFYGDALIFENLNSQWVRVWNPKSGKGVEMTFPGFPLLGIWSAKNDGPYVCLEPWTGCATRTSEGDRFEEKKNMTFLPPKATAEYSFSVAVL